MCPTKPCYRTTGGGMSPASFSHQTHTTSAFRCRTFLFARDRSICLRRGAAPHVRLLAMPCTTETPEGKACTKEAGEAPPSIIQPAADRPSRGQRGCPAVAAVEDSAAGRHTASPPAARNAAERIAMWRRVKRARGGGEEED
jgi:hypothetical protein